MASETARRLITRGSLSNVATAIPYPFALRWLSLAVPRTRCASRSSAPGRPASTRPSTVRLRQHGRGRHVRPPADAVRARARRRRARPPEDQVGDPPLREDGGPRGLPLLRQRRGRPRRHRGRARSSATTRSSTPTGRRPTASSGSPARTCPARTPRPSFVAWYNAHPDFADHTFDLDAKRAVVIGNGNVAADVARMLALPRAELDADRHRRPRDRGARRSRGSRRSSCSGAAGPRRRRSPTPRCASSASSPTPTSSSTRPRWSSTKPRREYVESDDCDPTNRRNVEIFTDFSQRQLEGKPKRVVLRFCCSPVEIKGDGKVESIVIGRNELYRDESGSIRARDTGEREELECGLVLRSIGYKGVGLEGIPFDAGRGLIPNEAGRVTRPGVRRAGRRPLRGRLDQARPLRRDRNEQEGRPGHGRRAARRPRGREGARARRDAPSRSRSCSAERAATTSPTSAGRRSTPPRSAPASRTGARGSSSARSTRWSRPRRPRAPADRMADLAELKLMIDRGAPRRRGRGDRRGRRRPPARRGHALRSSKGSRGSTSTGSCATPSAALRRRLDPRALDHLERAGLSGPPDRPGPFATLGPWQQTQS